LNEGLIVATAKY